MSAAQRPCRVPRDNFVQSSVLAGFFFGGGERKGDGIKIIPISRNKSNKCKMQIYLDLAGISVDGSSPVEILYQWYPVNNGWFLPYQRVFSGLLNHPPLQPTLKTRISAPSEVDALIFKNTSEMGSPKTRLSPDVGWGGTQLISDLDQFGIASNMWSLNWCLHSFLYI